MKSFPMFIALEGRRVVIAGGGEQAAQKCRLMLKTEARICLLAPVLDAELAALHAAGRVVWRAGAITASDFTGAALVFIASGSPPADACLHALAKAAGALVNVVDQPALCDAITPAIVDRDPVIVAIGTEGTAPVLARQIKTSVEQLLEPRLGDLAALAGRLRDQAAARLSPTARRALWRWVFAGPVRVLHRQGAEREAARLIKQAILTGAPADSPRPNLALVTAGPASDSDLISLRAVQRLQEADVIFHDGTVASALELARRDAARVCLCPCAEGTNSPTDAIKLAELISRAKQGARVVWLTQNAAGGARQMATLNAAGLLAEVVPGVSA